MTWDSLKFGEMVSLYRDEHFMSRRELAGRSGLHCDAVRLIEAGAHRSARVETIVLIARAFGLHPSVVFNWGLRRG